MDWNLKILGSGSALPTNKRKLSGQLLNTQYHSFLFDCSEGIQFRFKEYNVKFFSINRIFISHFHGDHIFGVFGLITTFHMLKRTEPLFIYAFKGLDKVCEDIFKLTNTKLEFELIFVYLNDDRDKVIFEDEHIEVHSFPLKHRIPCCGFFVKEKLNHLNLNKEFLENNDIPLDWLSRLQKGEDFVKNDGEIISNSKITLPPRPLKSFAYCSDTSFFPEIVDSIKNVKLLYHEATFDNEHQKDGINKLHSTAEEAAKIATLANADTLLIGHFSSRFININIFKEEAKMQFYNVICAEDGMDITF